MFKKIISVSILALSLSGMSFAVTPEEKNNVDGDHSAENGGWLYAGDIRCEVEGYNPSSGEPVVSYGIGAGCSREQYSGWQEMGSFASVADCRLAAQKMLGRIFYDDVCFRRRGQFVATVVFYYAHDGWGWFGNSQGSVSDIMK